MHSVSPCLISSPFSFFRYLVGRQLVNYINVDPETEQLEAVQQETAQQETEPVEAVQQETVQPGGEMEYSIPVQESGEQ